MYWDQQDVPLEDIERIEVIRGPGGTIWGANAVDGVINIITRNSKDTKGALVSAGGGTVNQGFLDARIRYERVKRLLESVEGLTKAQVQSHDIIPGDAVIREFIGGSTIKIPHNE